MNTKTTRRLFALCLALAAGLSASAVNYPCGTYTIVGLARDARSLALGSVPSDSTYRMRAVATNNAVLAECDVYAPSSGGSGNNFRLEVPLSAVATARTAAVGDDVQLVLVEDGNTSAVASEPLPITSAFGATNVTVQLYAAQAFTNRTSRQVVTVSQAYLDNIAPWLKERGLVYDPFADFDGDGASNYLEYRSGTDPFDKTDKLSILAFERSEENVRITFEYTGGVTYAVGSSPKLDEAPLSWKREGFRPEKPSASTVSQVLVDGDARRVGVADLYLMPTNSASWFYRLEVK